MFTISPNYFRDRLPHPGTVDTVLLYYQYHIAVVTVPYLGTHNDSIDRLVKVTDIMSNVLGIKNNAPLPQSGKAGGQMSHSYTYDPLYRLASATGTYRGTDNKTASYTLAMGYDNMHRITSKKQHLSQTGVQFDGTLNAGYELAYTYQKAEGKKFQLDNVRDINYRTEETPTESTNINNGHKYTYDANGNLVYINTSRVKKDGKEDEKATEQKYRWDEENRLLAADENGFVSNYWYDADGERTVKTSGENEAIYVNSEFSGGNTGTARFSLYVSPYLVAGQGGKYTKHIYIGSQRIVSKLGDLASYGADPRRIPYAGNEADGLTINYKDKYAKQLQSIKDNYKAFDQPYNGKDNDDYVNGQGFCCNDATPEAAQARAMNASTRSAVDNNFYDKDNYEKMQFYYHPDHLGSSSYITNLDGEVAQHIEYVPFGEVFIEERNNTWNTPYLFNAKEFDEETGLYYYGARYYEPRLSLWMSTDPLQEKFVDASPYVYCLQNPIIILDYNGADTVFVNPGGTEAKRISSKNNVTFVHNLKAKNIQTKNLSGKSHIGWIEADMPGVINYNEGNIDLSSSKYQKYDYLIAAEVSYFNQNKNRGITPKHTNGLYINNPSSIPNLDPDIVKAIIMQETRIGTAPGSSLNNAKSDIMQANVWYSASSNDWNDSKSQFGLRKMGGATPQLSVHAGIGILYQKGLRSDGKNVYFKGWQIAIQRYNGGGVKNYLQKVNTYISHMK